MPPIWIAIDEKFEPKPQMADSHTVSPDGLTYTTKLRSGLKWHDGKPVTADDRNVQAVAIAPGVVS